MIRGLHFITARWGVQALLWSAWRAGISTYSGHSNWYGIPSSEHSGWCRWTTILLRQDLCYRKISTCSTRLWSDWDSGQEDSSTLSTICVEPPWGYSRWWATHQQAVWELNWLMIDWLMFYGYFCAHGRLMGRESWNNHFTHLIGYSHPTNWILFGTIQKGGSTSCFVCPQFYCAH